MDSTDKNVERMNYRIIRRSRSLLGRVGRSLDCLITPPFFEIRRKFFHECDHNKKVNQSAPKINALSNFNIDLNCSKVEENLLCPIYRT